MLFQFSVFWILSFSFAVHQDVGLPFVYLLFNDCVGSMDGAVGVLKAFSKKAQKLY
jgi:hypothetical protein